MSFDADETDDQAWQRRAKSFADWPDLYDLGRPSYPMECVPWLLGDEPIGAGELVVDLAAGTGKLSRCLAELTAARVLSVDLSLGMVDLAPRPAVVGRAEAIPLRDGRARSVTVAQAFHWFDQRRALDEVARVLVPGGWLALVWHERVQTPFVRDVWRGVPDELERKASPEAPWRQALMEHGGFGPLEHTEFAFVQRLTGEELVALVGSHSYVAAMGHARWDIMASVCLDLERHGIDRHDAVDIPYRTACFRTRRV